MYKTSQFFLTTLNVGGGITNSQTSGIVIADSSGIDDVNDPGIALLNYSDPLNTSNAEWITYTSISANTFQGVTRGQEGFSAKTHDNGVQVAFPLSKSHINNLAEALAIGGVLTNGVTGTLDEDDMASNSATKLATQQSIKAYVDANLLQSGLYQQALINGNFDIWQRNTTFTPNDDVYICDHWNALVETNGAWTFARDTDVPTGGIAKYSIKCTNVTFNNQCALVQFIENVDAVKLAGRTVSLSFYAKTNSTEIANLRASVLAWNSTADSITSDVISSWASDGTDPTFATNWTKEIAGSNKALTSSWQRFTIEGISLDTASTANLAVIIWVDDGTIAANDDFYVTGVQLNVGSTALNLISRSFSDELAACERYFQKSFDYGVTPAQSTTDYLGAEFFLQIGTAVYGSVRAKFNGRMRTTPTITSYSPGAADTHWYDIDNGQTRTAVVDNVGESGFTIRGTNFSGTGSRNYIHWAAAAEL